MSIVAWIVLGLIAGVIAKSLLGGRAKHGVIVTILIGVAGALLGGWAASNVFGIAVTGGFFDLSTWIIAILGSVVLLLIYHMMNGGARSFRRARR
nr:GlsB/YeaQ/YmgE family stress response membrane protein [Actinocrispum wychmicini]